MHTFTLSRMFFRDTPEVIQVEQLRNHFDVEPQYYYDAIKISCFPVRPEDNPNDKAIAYIYQIKVDALKLFRTTNTSAAHYNELKKILNMELSLFGFDVDDFAITRVDYCNNIVVKDKKERELLFKLLQSCPTHAAYTVREDQYESSLYSKSKSRTLNIYDKERERRDKMRIRHDHQFYPKVYELNVIRIEHQVKKDHIKYKRRNGIPSNYDYWINAETEQAYMAQIHKMIPVGDFYSESIIKNFIQTDVTLNGKKRSNLLAFCDTVANGGMDAAKKHWCYNTYNSYLSYFADNNLSPIPIPDEWGIEHIRNPFVL